MTIVRSRLKRFVTLNDVMSFHPCKYYPREVVAKLFDGRKKAAVLDVARHKIVPSNDRIWLLARAVYIGAANVRLFAVDCASRALHREQKAGATIDDRLWAALDTAKQFANDRATAAELFAAGDAAWDVAGRAIRHAVHGTGHFAWSTVDAACSAVEATKSNEDIALRAANSAARSAAWARTRDTWDLSRTSELRWQLRRLCKYLEAVSANH